MKSTRLFSRKEASILTAEFLLDIGAVGLRPSNPFILASGKPSPVYVDCRRIISHTRVRSMITKFLVDMIERDIGKRHLNNIAGGETAGIPFAALIADRMNLPMTYVRKKSKGYGKNSRIEGLMKSTDKVLLAEDLATDGKSKLSFVRAIRETGASCEHTAVVFFYDIFDGSVDELESHGLRIHFLTNWSSIIEVVENKRALGDAELDLVREFLSAPDRWQHDQIIQ